MISAKNKPKIVHELVRHGRARVLHSLIAIYGFGVNDQREDGCTPLHLASWHKREAIKQELLQLGADPSVRNNYGEMAAEIDCHAIRPLLQAAGSIEEILKLIQDRLHDFSALDKVFAFHLLGDRTSHYDGCFRGYAPSCGQEAIRNEPAFRKLVLACTSLVDGPMDATSQDVWGALVRAMMMLREESILQAMAKRVAQDSCQEWGPSRIVLILWGLAKVDGGKPRWKQGFQAFGDTRPNCSRVLYILQGHQHDDVGIWQAALQARGFVLRVRKLPGAETRTA